MVVGRGRVAKFEARRIRCFLTYWLKSAEEVRHGDLNRSLAHWIVDRIKLYLPPNAHTHSWNKDAHVGPPLWLGAVRLCMLRCVCLHNDINQWLYEQLKSSQNPSTVSSHSNLISSPALKAGLDYLLTCSAREWQSNPPPVTWQSPQR